MQKVINLYILPMILQVQSAKMALESAGIPYQVSDDGFQLKVPVEHVGQEGLQLPLSRRFQEWKF